MPLIGPHNGETWRAIAMFLAGLVVAMATFYVAEFKRTITRDEAAQLIEEMRPGPPWAHDRVAVFDRLGRVERDVTECVRQSEFDTWRQQERRR